MQLLYNSGIFLYGAIIRLAALFNAKARLWVKGRKEVWRQLEKFESEEKPVYWFHCASLGEFEQGRPVMERLKFEMNCKLVISFFSPSGYEIRKDYGKADLVFYLPLDTKKNAKRVCNYLQPEKVFFIKYEFWANYIFTLQKRQVKLHLISGLFRPDQIFFKRNGGFFRKVLGAFDHVFVQNQASKTLLHSIDIHSTVSGDTRFDRVMKNAENVKPISLIEQFINNQKVLVIGSSWVEDESVLMPLINSDSYYDKVIIAPHEVSEDRLKRIEEGIKKSTVRYSKSDTNMVDYQVMIIDNIGMLMNVYQYAHIAYVGGGFKTGLHNILEPASFGVPVIFGTEHSKFPEAQLFINYGVGFEISTSQELSSLYYQLKAENKSSEILDFMNDHTGATDHILTSI